MKNLKAIRLKKNKSQLAIATRVGVTQESISQYESGDAYPTVKVLLELAKYLGTSTDYLLDLTSDPTPVKYMKKELNEKEFELLEKYKYLATKDQLQLMGYIDGLMKVSN